MEGKCSPLPPDITLVVLQTIADLSKAKQAGDSAGGLKSALGGRAASGGAERVQHFEEQPSDADARSAPSSFGTVEDTNLPWSPRPGEMAR